jgi:hypothetical protein
MWGASVFRTLLRGGRFPTLKRCENHTRNECILWSSPPETSVFFQSSKAPASRGFVVNSFCSGTLFFPKIFLFTKVEVPKKHFNQFQFSSQDSAFPFFLSLKIFFPSQVCCLLSFFSTRWAVERGWSIRR